MVSLARVLTHPSEKGYEIWAKAIEPELKKMLGE